jgi:hypothetical protein
MRAMGTHSRVLGQKKVVLLHDPVDPLVVHRFLSVPDQIPHQKAMDTASIPKPIVTFLPKSFVPFLTENCPILETHSLLAFLP